MLSERKVTVREAVKSIVSAINVILAKDEVMIYKGVDRESEETMFILYSPGTDFCVNVLISENLHGNEAFRQMRQVIDVNQGGRRDGQ